MITVKTKVFKEQLKSNMDLVVSNLLVELMKAQDNNIETLYPTWADLNYEEGDEQAEKITVSLNCYKGKQGQELIVDALVSNAKAMYFTPSS